MSTTSTEHVLTTPATPIKKQGLPALMLGAMGVVFGDIGTSPLYAFREAFIGTHGASPSHDNVFGILSMMLWALILVVSLKYVVFIMRANNKGEGGIMALIALIQRAFRDDSRRRKVLVTIGLFGDTWQRKQERTY